MADDPVGGVDKPALQVVVLGSGGGPIESNTTAFLVRSTSTNWQRGSLLAVDAGVHLSAILKILETHPFSKDHEGKIKLLEGPFEGLELPYTSTAANAAHITRSLVESYLITHPHLDHISGFVVNTASLSGSKPKRLAALPSTIEAFKNHIFNNVIWPNLSDENNGAGLVTYMRLVEGGSLAIGDGEGRGYIEICEGLSVKTWSVSHGHCMENHSHQGSRARSGSPAGYQIPMESPRLSSQRSQRKSSTGSELYRTDSFPRTNACVYDSSAYFIRDIITGHEVLIFGDVEPDSISLSPRNRQVWMDAAPKIVEKKLRGIFVECSYADDQPKETLFGHLAPRYLIEELKALAAEIALFKSTDKEKEGKKRKRLSNGIEEVTESNNIRRRISRGSIELPVTPMSRTKISFPTSFDSPKIDEEMEDVLSPRTDFPVRNLSLTPLVPLEGVKIFIIHVKDKLNDSPHVSETILTELLAHEAEEKLGCEFVIAKAGQVVNL